MTSEIIKSSGFKLIQQYLTQSVAGGNSSQSLVSSTEHAKLNARNMRARKSISYENRNYIKVEM